MPADPTIAEAPATAGPRATLVAAATQSNARINVLPSGQSNSRSCLADADCLVLAARSLGRRACRAHPQPDAAPTPSASDGAPVEIVWEAPPECPDRSHPERYEDPCCRRADLAERGGLIRHDTFWRITGPTPKNGSGPHKLARARRRCPQSAPMDVRLRSEREGRVGGRQWRRASTARKRDDVCERDEPRGHGSMVPPIQGFTRSIPGSGFHGREPVTLDAPAGAAWTKAAGW